MKVSFHDYELKNISNTKSSRKGTLLRFAFDDGFGYADCHPWPEFGDLPLQEQKNNLKRGNFTYLTKRSYHFAKLDAQARYEGKSLLSGSVRSHLHFAGQAKKGFDCFKMKVRGNENIVALMKSHPNIKWRFDFNSTSNYEDFCRFLEEIDCEKVDFIEDPFPYCELLWKKIENDFGIQLAADFEKKKMGEWLPSVLIVKPALEDIDEYRRKKTRLVITSLLAHPLDQMTAAYSALQLNSDEIMGLYTHVCYESNDFSNQFGEDPNSFFCNLGTGFGFDDLLNGLDWHD